MILKLTLLRVSQTNDALLPPYIAFVMVVWAHGILTEFEKFISQCFDNPAKVIERMLTIQRNRDWRFVENVTSCGGQMWRKPPEIAIKTDKLWHQMCMRVCMSECIYERVRAENWKECCTRLLLAGWNCISTVHLLVSTVLFFLFSFLIFYISWWLLCICFFNKNVCHLS